MRIYCDEIATLLAHWDRLKQTQVAKLPGANDRRLQWPNPISHIKCTSALFTIGDLIAKYEMKANAASEEMGRGARPALRLVAARSRGGEGSDKKSFTRGRARYLRNIAAITCPTDTDTAPQPMLTVPALTAARSTSCYLLEGRTLMSEGLGVRCWLTVTVRITSPLPAATIYIITTFAAF